MKKPIGYISYTHGLEGSVKIVPMVSKSNFEDFIKNTDVFIEGSDIAIKIAIIAFNGKVFLCKVEGVNSIEEANKILKKEIVVEIKDANYISGENVLGFDVFVCTNSKDDVIEYGKVVDCGNYGNGELIEVKLTENGKTEFYRCSKDDIKDVNYNEKKILLFKRNEC